MSEDLWDPHTWPNRDQTDKEMLDRLRILLYNIGDELLRTENPFSWARNVVALGKLIDEQESIIMRHRVQYNLGIKKREKLRKFTEAWDQIGRETE